jgi:diguanylate cyclase (GGDEF)-like protein
LFMRDLEPYDKTASKTASRLLASAQVLYQFIGQLCDQMYMLCADGKVIRALQTNNNAAPIAGKGSDPLELVHPEEREAFNHMIGLLLRKSQPFTLECRIAISNQGWRWSELRGFPIASDESGDEGGFGLTVVNIADRKTKEDRLVWLAYHDALTGLPNRRLFHSRISQMLRDAKRAGDKVGVIYLDIDDFKLVNDSYGHEAGDQLLCSIAGRVGGCLREGDLFARMGGDEFVILLPGLESRAGVQTVIDRILKVVREGWTLTGHKVDTTVSLGAVLYPDDGNDSESLLRKVDEMLYQVKGAGRDGGIQISRPSEEDQMCP